MEENTPIIEQPNEQPTTQPADTGNKGSEKLFSQEDVNRIVKERLDRDRARRAPAEPSEAEKQEAALTARENRLSCREHLLDKGLPSSLLDAFDTSDFEKFKKAVDVVSELIVERARYAGPAPLYDPIVPTSGKPVTGFERGKKHKPRQVNP